MPSFSAVDHVLFLAFASSIVLLALFASIGIAAL